MSASRAAIDMEAGEKTQVSTDRPSIARWITQPLFCIVVVIVVLVYVHRADLDTSELVLLNNSSLLSMLGQHMEISIIATLIVCAVSVPLGILLTRGSVRRYASSVTTVASFGQAAPSIGLLAIAAEIWGFNAKAAIIALIVYGILPIVANTVAGLNGVDARLIEASRGMGMSSAATLLQVELPMALPVIMAGIRTALVLIVGTATLAAFIGAGGLGNLITTGIKLQQNPVLVVGAILVAVLALFIDWLARLVEMAAAPKGMR